MKFFRTLKIRYQIWSLSLFFILTLLFASAITYFVVKKLGNDTKSLAMDQLPAIKNMTLTDMHHDNLRAISTDAVAGIKSKSDVEMQDLSKESKENQKEMLQNISEIQKLNLSIDTKELVTKVTPEIEKYTQLANDLVDLAVKREEQKLKEKQIQFQAQFELLEKKLGELNDHISSEASKVQSESISLASSTSILILGVSIFACLIGFLFSFWFIKNLNSRLVPLTQMIENINTGKYELTYNDNWSDELNFLGCSILSMSKKIKEQIDGIKTALSASEEAARTASVEQKKAVEASDLASAEKQKAIEALIKADEATKAAESEKAKVEIALTEAELHKEEAFKAQKIASIEQEKAINLMKQQEQQSIKLKQKIDKILNIVEMASKGNFKGRVSITEKEPIDSLATQLNELFHKMDSSLSEVDNASKNLSITSDQFVNLNTSLSEAAKTTQSVANQALDLATQAQTESNDLSLQANEIRSSSSKIYDAAQSTAKSSTDVVQKAKAADEVIKQLAVASNEIGEFTKVISTISSQTNLLALNATIEAARAGEAGRGFAVVANEVKELARQTSNAAEQVELQITNILNVVGQVENSIKQIIQFSEKMKEQSENVFESVNLQTESTQKMFDVINKTLNNLEEINLNLTSVKSMATNSASVADRVQNETLKMSDLSFKLRNVVSQFSTENENMKPGLKAVA